MGPALGLVGSISVKLMSDAIGFKGCLRITGAINTGRFNTDSLNLSHTLRQI